MSDTLTASPDQELATLIAEQEEDARWGHKINYRRELSLDQPLSHDVDAGTLADVVGVNDSGLQTLSGDLPAVSTRRIPRPQKWTRRAILKHIRAWVKEHGEPPKYQEWVKPDGRGFPSTASVVRLFGSFNAAIEKAGFKARPVGGGKRHPIKGTALRPRIYKQRRTARLSSDNLAAAFVLYDREGLSTSQIANLIWQKFGYPSAKSCKEALLVGFYAEGFPVRNRGEARRQLPPEQRRTMAARRLTEARRLELRSRVDEPNRVLAEEFGVSISAIAYHRRCVARKKVA